MKIKTYNRGEAQKAMEQAVKDAINSIKNKFPWKK